MTLPLSGPMSMSMIAAQLGVSSSSPLNLNNGPLRALLESNHPLQQPTNSIIRFSDAYGKPITTMLTTTPSGAPGVITDDGKSLYLLNGNGFNIYNRNSTTGNLTYVNDFTFTADGNVLCFSISPDGKSIYCGTDTNQLILLNRNLSTGALNYVESIYGMVNANGSAIYSDCFVNIVISSDNLNVYCYNSLWFTDSQTSTPHPNVFQYSRNTTTGHLSALSPAYITTATNTNLFPLIGSSSLAINSDGLALYGIGNNTIDVFTRSAGTGVLSTNNSLSFDPISGTVSYITGPVPNVININADRLAVSPDGLSLYAIVNSSLNKYSTSSLSLVSSITLPSSSTTRYLDISFSEDGLLVYVLSNYSSILKFSTVGGLSMTSEDVFDTTYTFSPGDPSYDSCYGSVIFSKDNMNYYVVINYSPVVYKFSR